MTRAQEECLEKMRFHMGQLQALAGEFSANSSRRVEAATYTNTGIPLFIMEGGVDRQLVVKED